MAEMRKTRKPTTHDIMRELDEEEEDDLRELESMREDFDPEDDYLPILPQ
jgi:hypothetical protein